jgi:choline dehydrogenase-like flavoprotein
LEDRWAVAPLGVHENGDAEGWTARPLEPLDFEPPPGLPLSGWPFRYRAVEPYYLRAQVVARLGPFAYDAACWEREGARRLQSGDCVETNVLQRGHLLSPTMSAR